MVHGGCEIIVNSFLSVVGCALARSGASRGTAAWTAYLHARTLPVRLVVSGFWRWDGDVPADAPTILHPPSNIVLPSHLGKGLGFGARSGFRSRGNHLHPRPLSRSERGSLLPPLPPGVAEQANQAGGQQRQRPRLGDGGDAKAVDWCRAGCNRSVPLTPA